MKNRLLISVFFFSFFALVPVNESKAQMSVTANLGLINFPSAFEGGESYSEVGINIAGKYNLSEKLRAGLNLGYFFKGEDSYTLFTMPITGLVEYSLSTNAFSPYLGADLGFYRTGISGDGASISSTNFGLAPVAGFNYALSDKMSLNANFKYHYIMTDGESTGAIGLNAGLTFNL